MHIPDGYLSPQTCAVLGAAMVPVWGMAARKVKATLKARQAPLLAIGAAFSFTIMMYNIPIPDGTTAHATGGALLAILLGPWAASIGISIALAIQALFFGDGGILAFGANAFNMAFILPFASYYLYRLLTGRTSLTSGWRAIAAAVAGFVGLNLAALAAAVEFGLQPLLFHTAGGVPLYSPYPLNMAVPAMALAHLLVAGPAEGLITGLVVRYLQRVNSGLLRLYPAGNGNRAAGPAVAAGTLANRQEIISPAANSSFGLKKLALGLVILVLLSPLGLLAAGTAWGEWSPEDLQQILGFVPPGLARLATTWTHTLFPDYTVPGLEGSFLAQALGYILAAAAGLAIIFLIFLALNRLLFRPGKAGTGYNGK
ncbi:cobalt transporter CbiM [Moorella sp. Hama-1]|uniref:cobalt transporter CbiM n=1 Tax=Moorella sp. Hama-1 TaxID=2138101 RepID=UPI000D651E7B|nr:cobalt transporter CbiM [Moorella sp. Hama-1]BCV22143.1 cobalt transporter CbiM [Moorella sp. Hama-1]